ncbi:MAG: Thioesterase domain [Phormidesmis priestleyi Ana]|uniref:Thioesterase domain n=1 Tax=Phormidesmis priestleyi Ana TaxID=1666911 RepID=A0A0P8BS28_9CYAN|nr:MAG: Thioesterase domain [Phormidesmis priestleyi Ana]
MNSRLTKLSAVILLTVGVIVLLSPLNSQWLNWYLAFNSTLLKLIVDLTRVSLIALLLAGLLSPFESLGWWAGWYGDGIETHIPATIPMNLSAKSSSLPQPSRYIIYLDGISQSSADYPKRVQNFLNTLAAALPSDMVFIQDIMAYSALNRPLTIQRPFARVWRGINHIETWNANSPLDIFVNLRNTFQVAVSTDNRYGPVFNRGTAQVILNSLRQRGYQPGEPITLIGYSGGAQVALGAVTYLKYALDAPIEVISISGVVSGNNGVALIDRLYHLKGDRDLLAQLGAIMFPKRWPIMSWSSWNLAKVEGRVQLISLGPVSHSGPSGPIDPVATLPNGNSHLGQTMDIVMSILT